MSSVDASRLHVHRLRSYQKQIPTTWLGSACEREGETFFARPPFPFRGQIHHCLKLRRTETELATEEERGKKGLELELKTFGCDNTDL